MNFEELIQDIFPKLRAITKRLNTRCAFFDSDDLYQEALIHLWEKFCEGKLSDKTESYILQGCFFFLKNYIRVAYKKIDSRTISFSAGRDESEEKPIEENIAATDPENRFSLMVIDILVDDVLPSLNAREKEVFLLSLEELTTREIGEKLGISHVMVVKIEGRIREKCRQLKEEFLNG